MRDVIKTLLENDATLMATLTGGLHTKKEISRQDTPAAFDGNGEIRPCGLLKFGTIAPHGPYDHSARLYFSVLLYERSGYDDVETARERIYTLLHRQCVSPETGSCWTIEHADDVLDQEDSALGCSLEITRYAATIMRR